MEDLTDTEIRFPHPSAPDYGDAIEVAPGILWIRLPLPMKLDHVNIYALDDGADGWTVVDTGMNWKRGRAAWEKALAGPLGGQPVHRVIVTHHHPDHVGNLGWLAGLGAQVVATRTAWLMARMLTLDVQDTISPQALAFYTAAGMEPRLLAARRSERPFNFADSVLPIPLGFTRIVEGSRLRAGGRDWRVHIGHGHAPEHATLWSEDGALVIAGDQILPGISPNLGVYPTEPDADPVGEWLEACTRLGAIAEARAGRDVLVLPGHKLPFTGLTTRLTQLIDNHHTALARLCDHLRTPRSAHECFAPLYKRSIGDGEYGLALVEAVGHLNHLLAEGKVSRTRRADGAWAWQVIGP